MDTFLVVKFHSPWFQGSTFRSRDVGRLDTYLPTQLLPRARARASVLETWVWHLVTFACIIFHPSKQVPELNAPVSVFPSHHIALCALSAATTPQSVM